VAILDARSKYTSLPTNEESMQVYFKFVQEHWAEEKFELIRAYHLDQNPNLPQWSNTFMEVLTERRA
jgi:hypothetical protein